MKDRLPLSSPATEIAGPAAPLKPTPRVLCVQPSFALPFRKRLGCVDAEEVQAPPLEYLDRYELRYVSANGGIRWNNRWVNVSTTCIGEYVGLEEIEDGDCYPCPRTKG